MAKKTTGKRQSRKPRVERNMEEYPVMDENSQDWQEATAGAETYNRSQERDYKEILKEFFTSPAVKYVAGGIATALLTRLANNMTDRYPEISNFIRENMDNLESKLGEFRSNFNEDARH